MKVAILLNLALLLFLSAPVNGATLVVSPEEYPTIQAAIDDANEGDTVMITPGTYTGPGNGDIDFRGKAITVRSVAPENPQIVAKTVIDCNGSEADPHRGFYFHTFERPNSVLDGLTIVGGPPGPGIFCSSSSPTIRNCVIRDWHGGGIGLWMSNATIINCTITGNSHPEGGGLNCDESSPTITNCTFANNWADSGGAVYCGGEYAGRSPTITNCTFASNWADSGGAVYCGGQYSAIPTITNCTFTDNSADYGGAVFCDGQLEHRNGSSPPITSCTFSENTAYRSGGDICCGEYSRALIRGCTFTGNRAHSYESPFFGRGGGAVYGCEGEISNCVITANHADSGGGGLYLCKRVVNCVISGNSAGQDGGGTYGCSQIANCVVTGNSARGCGGGMFMGYYDFWIWLADYPFFENGGAIEADAVYGYPDSQVLGCTISGNTAEERYGGVVCSGYNNLPLTNCIFWGNTDSTGSGESAQIGGATPYVTFSCIQDDDPDDAYIPFGGDANDNIDDNPMFVRSADDGGDGWGDDPETPDVDEGANDDFGDLHLTLTSPCINSGTPGFFVGTIQVDMDGQPRVIGGRIDMGADEYALVIVVTKPEGGEVWVSGSKHEIKWESYGVAGTVDILLSTNSGSDWTTIEDNIANSGSYLWHLPQEADSNQCVISVVPGSPNPDVISIESGVFTIHPDTPGPVVPSKWKSLGGDFDRAGLSENFGPELGCVKWQFETQGPVSASPTIGADDRVHIACEDGKLYTLDANGVLLWSCDTNSPLISAPTIGPDGTLYVGAEDGRVYAIDINGNLRWTHTTDGFVYSSPAVSADGNSIYACSSDGAFYALGRDGSELWSFRTTGPGVVGGAIFASPAIGPDGTVYTGGFNEPNLYALDPDDGSVKWVCNFEHLMYPGYPQYHTVSGRPFASPVVAPDGTIYQTLLLDDNMHAIEPNEGTIIWSLRLGTRPPTYTSDADGWSEPALGVDGTIYVSFNDPNLRAVDPNGSVKWVTRLGMNEGFSLTVGSDGLIYAAGYDGYLCVVDPNGREMARFQSTGWLIPPVILTDGTIIASDANNRIWAIADQDCEGQASILHRPEDLDGSGAVDFVDFAMLAADWLSCNHPGLPCSAISWDGAYFTGDVDRNLYVDFIDLAAVANRWLSEE